MINDDDRRKIAQRMRDKICFMYRDREWYESGKDVVECGNRAYRDIADSVIRYSHFGNDYIGVVERLAELIDAPAAKGTIEHDGTSVCGNCGFRFEVRVAVPGHFSANVLANHCPQCGRLLVWCDEVDE